MSFEIKQTEQGTFVAELPDGTGVHGDTEDEAAKNLVRYLLQIAEHRGRALVELKGEVERLANRTHQPADFAAVVAHLETTLPTGDGEQ